MLASRRRVYAIGRSETFTSGSRFKVAYDPVSACRERSLTRASAMHDSMRQGVTDATQASTSQDFKRGEDGNPGTN